jgi:hypothetical protein
MFLLPAVMAEKPTLTSKVWNFHTMPGLQEDCFLAVDRQAVMLRSC